LFTRYLYVQNHVFLIFAILSFGCATQTTPSDAFRDDLISGIANKSTFLEDLKPKELTEYESDEDSVHANITDIAALTINIEKKRASQDLPNKYWEMYQKSLEQYLVDFRAKGLKETHSTVVSSYKRQLSAAKTEQLKFLLRRSDFESTDAFNQIVDTGQLHTLFHKEKIKNLVITVAQHDTRISELNSQFNRQTPQLNRVRQSSLTASEELEVVHNLSIKAMEALNNDNEDLWATLICGSKGASYVGSHSWKGAKHYLGKISTYVILEKVPRPKITTNRSPSSSILYHVKNDDLATDHRLYKHNINFRFDTKSYNNEKPCVKLNY